MDLSKYRDFQLGASLPTIAKQTSVKVTAAKAIHRRPALIQELEWRPQPEGVKAHSETAKDVVFSFYDGELYRITVDYDRYQTEGLTTEDIVDAISATYGTALRPQIADPVAEDRSSDQEAIVAQWQDPQYRFDLFRSSYGPGFKLVGVLKKLEAPVQAAILEAKRLDVQEEPQRDAARAALEKETEKTKLEQARLVNRPKFKP